MRRGVYMFRVQWWGPEIPRIPCKHGNHGVCPLCEEEFE